MTGTLRTLADFPALLCGRGQAPAIAVVQQGKVQELASAALGTAACRLAGALAGLGVGKGAAALLLGPAGPDWITVRLAIAAAGAVAVALDDAASDAELRVLAADSGAAIAFAQASHAARLAAASANLAIWTFDTPEAGAPFARWTSLAEGPRVPLPAVQPHEAAMLVYTSGTTGAPKSFTLTHANILHNVHALAGQRIATAGDRVLLPLPLHHVYPLTVGIFCTLAIGAVLVLTEAADAPRIAAALRAARVTLVIGVPRLYSALAAGVRSRAGAGGALPAAAFTTLLALSLLVRRRTGRRIGRLLFPQVHAAFGGSLRVLASGGAKPDIDAVWTLEALGFEHLSGYGLAETASILTNQAPGSAVVGTEGRPLPGVELRIDAPDAEGNGEIQARGPSVFAGYRAPAEANQTAFTTDGWFRTGDLGRLDRDGNLLVTGRAKEMIVLGGGKNVFPEELEAALARPEFRELALTEKDGALVALVLPDLARIAAGANTRVADVVRIALTEAARDLPHWQKPAGFALVREPLPRTRLGKFRRFQLPALYDAALAGRAGGDPGEWSEADAVLLATPAGAALLALLEARAHGRRVGPATSPALELGLDSLGFLELSMALEGQTGIALGEDDVAAVETVRDLLHRVGAKTPAAHAEPSAAIEPRWLAPRSLGERAAGAVLRGVNAVLMRLVFRLRVEGRANIPDGAVIVCLNHASDLDPPIVAAALPRQALDRVRWSGDAGRLFGGKVGRFLARAARIFPVEERRPAVTLAYARAVLAAGDCLVWFPESWRSPDGRLQPFLPGIGRIVRESGAPVVPGRIAGTFEAMPRSARFPRSHPVRVTFGPPIAAGTLLADGADDAAVAGRIRDALATLPARTNPAG